MATFPLRIFVLAFASLLPCRAWAVPGDLDPSFGTAGIARTAPDVVDFAEAAARDASGRFVVGGGSGGGFQVARLTAGGALDATFAGGGVATVVLGVPFYRDRVTALALQPDGSIVVTGAVDDGVPGAFVLARLLSDGTLDASFGSGGVVSTPLSEGNGAWATSLALQADGRILVAGAGLVARYDATGTLDATFGTGGFVTSTIGTAPRGLALQSDQRILVLGATATGPAVARHASDGTTDASFGSGGVANVAATATVLGLVVQPDDRVVLGLGMIRANGPVPNALGAARLTSGGALDPSFGDAGVTSLPGGDPKRPDLIAAGIDRPLAVALDPQGRTLLVGSNERRGAHQALIARLGSDGKLDGSFGARGATTLGIRGKTSTGATQGGLPLVEPDGSITTVGSTIDGAIELARFFGACASVSCPVGEPLLDTDQDCECDAQDPCTSTGGTDLLVKPRPLLTLSRIAADPIAGNDALDAGGAFDLPQPATFATLAPDVGGIRIAIEGSDRVRRVDVALPGGTFTGTGSRGWGRTGRRWTYRDATGSPIGGFLKVTLADRSSPTTPRRVELGLAARNGAFPFTAPDVPHLSVTLGDATAGVCTESHFGGVDCTFNPAGTRLSCRK